MYRIKKRFCLTRCLYSVGLYPVFEIKLILKRPFTSLFLGDPMITMELETSLRMAFYVASLNQHKFVTVEHLLLTLLNNRLATEVLVACGANIEVLRKKLADHIDSTAVISTVTTDEHEKLSAEPTLGVQRVIQRAIMRVRYTGNEKKDVDASNLLYAIFGESDSLAKQFLLQEGVTRIDVYNYLHFNLKRERTITT